MSTFLASASAWKKGSWRVGFIGPQTMDAAREMPASRQDDTLRPVPNEADHPTAATPALATSSLQRQRSHPRQVPLHAAAARRPPPAPYGSAERSARAPG